MRCRTRNWGSLMRRYKSFGRDKLMLGLGVQARRGPRAGPPLKVYFCSTVPPFRPSVGISTNLWVTLSGRLHILVNRVRSLHRHNMTEPEILSRLPTRRLRGFKIFYVRLMSWSWTLTESDISRRLYEDTGNESKRWRETWREVAAHLADTTTTIITHHRIATGIHIPTGTRAHDEADIRKPIRLYCTISDAWRYFSLVAMGGIRSRNGA
jgi:hypothetical protein